MSTILIQQEYAQKTSDRGIIKVSQNFHLYRIRQRCTDETARYRRGVPYDPSFCFDLFYQALHEQNELAWTLLYEQYRRQVIIWTRRHSLFSSLDEDVEHFVADAFTRLHKYFTPDKFTDKVTLDSLLAYLRLCVHSAIQTYGREVGRRAPTEPIEKEGDDNDQKGHFEIPDDNPSPDISIPDDDLREQVKALIENLLKDEQERILYRAFFELGLKPKAIYEEYSGHFSNVKQINRIRERVVKRFKENLQLQALMSDYHS